MTALRYARKRDLRFFVAVAFLAVTVCGCGRPVTRSDAQAINAHVDSNDACVSCHAKQSAGLANLFDTALQPFLNFGF